MKRKENDDSIQRETLVCDKCGAITPSLHAATALANPNAEWLCADCKEAQFPALRSPTSD